MNRPIKFRAWDGKRMLFSESGDFYLMPNNKADIPSSTGHEFYRKDYPVMQFTGLHDKNGREIYEGDIVRLEQYNRGYLVVYKQSSFRLIHISNDSLKDLEWGRLDRVLELFETPTMTIIGNIYETLN